MKKYISDYIESYIYENKKPWHMPGHKRKEELNPLFKRDFTEVPGLDDYHHPEGIIKKSQEELSKVYGSYKSWYLVNGSTAGIVTAVFPVCTDGCIKKEKKGIIVASNCHKSVHNAVRLAGISPIYIEPDIIKEYGISGDIKAEKLERIVEEAEKEYDIKACVITSPTYEGIISDIEKISEILHKRKIILIVDEAHGAHLPFCSFLPKSSLYLGADIVVQSLHKTLPSLTQTAVLHMSDFFWDKEGIKRKKIGNNIRKYLSVFQTSSPSYIFLQAMENCVAWCDENITEKDEKGEYDGEFRKYEERIKNFRKKAEELKNIRLINFMDCKNKPFSYDETRLVFSFKNMFVMKDEKSREAVPATGETVSEILERDYGIVIEMSGKDYVVAISSVCDEICDFNELYFALSSLDKRLIYNYDKNGGQTEFLNIQNIMSDETVLNAMINTGAGELCLCKAVGKTAAEDIFVYPPGIPIIREGEIITAEHTAEITDYLKAGKIPQGIRLN